MSFIELFVVFIISVFILKPEDLKAIIAKIRQLKGVLQDSRQELMSHLSLDDDLTPSSQNDKVTNVPDQSEQINTYLLKIMKLGYEYSGDYSLEEVKKFYRRVENKKINSKKESD
ncbi:MAG: hypothetical protein DGJ47_000733 [Rickettsiaceae bacterium]